MAGYSRLIGIEEVGTALKAIRREIVDPTIASHRGRIVKTTGYGCWWSVKRHPELPPLRHEELSPAWLHDLGC
jgi:hypothetical protein